MKHGNAATFLVLGALALAAACSKADGSTAGLPAPLGPAAPPRRPLTPAAEVGKQLFFDKGLSASGDMSCATCHDPARAYGPPNDLAVQLGGPKHASPGVRAVPSIRYKEYTPGYADLLDNPDGFSAPAPGGGYAWDGRADSLGEQAKIPLLSPFEMANANAAEVAARLRASASAALFAKTFGAAALADASTALAKIQLALQSFQLEDPSFHPYNSKFDLHIYKKPGGEFTPAEERGLAVFNDEKLGNCAGCHFSDSSKDDGAPPQFTDYSYEAIGVPRNAEIPANRDRKHRDLGVCGPLRDDHRRAPAFCGLFKTPTLRNVATRGAFFHNGVFHTLEQAVRFYNTRDTRPELWYPTVRGVVQKYDDLPAAYRANIDKQMPLDGRAPGSRAPMTDQQVADLVCFLRTLTDDYRPPPAGQPSDASPACAR
jgi:cytochrome c peroxidase